MKHHINYTMLCDFYELTMANGYFKNGFYQRNTYFDVFFRSVPDGGGFAIAAGLERSLTILKICISMSRILNIFVPRMYLTRTF